MFCDGFHEDISFGYRTYVADDHTQEFIVWVNFQHQLIHQVFQLKTQVEKEQDPKTCNTDVDESEDPETKFP